MFKLTLVILEEELVFSEDVQDFLDNLAMFFQVFGEDEDVINVYAYDAVADEILENIIHHSLEGGRAVSHALCTTLTAVQTVLSYTEMLLPIHPLPWFRCS
jgi:hypothetical protein